MKINKALFKFNIVPHPINNVRISFKDGDIQRKCRIIINPVAEKLWLKYKLRITISII